MSKKYLNMNIKIFYNSSLKKTFLVLISVPLIIVIFSFLIRYTYNSLELEIKYKFKEKFTFYYENKVDDKYKIIL